jgi:RimJ/RimL family protein N-acetyltransferase
MGVLIGDASYRGKGVVAEVLIVSANWLRLNRQIREIWLGVDKENASAIRAYEKIGFCVADVSRIGKIGDTSNAMVWKIFASFEGKCPRNS